MILSCMAATASPTISSARTRHHRLSAHSFPGHHRRLASAGHVIQCVAFARQDSGIDLPGNAANWWDNAAGLYARGSTPEVGSVLNFRANERMRLGHVAVVTDIINNRMVRIDQSHWNSRGISRDVNVVDVSADNDWSAVRVELGHEEKYGSIYPTYGFIYPRPDDGVRVASRLVAPVDVGPLPSRLSAAKPRHEVTLEVAETPGRGIDLSTPGIIADAPDRDLR